MCGGRGERRCEEGEEVCGGRGERCVKGERRCVEGEGRGV